MKGGRGFFDNLYCWILGWIWKDASCNSTNQMVENVKTANFVYEGGKKTKRVKPRKNKTKRRRSY